MVVCDWIDYNLCINASYILESLVVIISFVLSTRINVDEFNTRLLLRVATRSITHEAERRASAS